MNQKATQCFVSECGKAQVFVENDMPIGVFHDFLMRLKGSMVDKMVQVHKEQEEMAKMQLKESEPGCCGGE